MKKIIFLGLMSLSVYGGPVESGKVKLGEKIFSYPKKIEGQFIPTSNVNSLDCQYLKKKVDQVEKVFSSCLKGISPSCTSLEFLYRWEGQQRTSLEELVIPSSHQNDFEFLFPRGTKLDLKLRVDHPEITYTDNSFTKRFSEVLELDESDQPHFKGNNGFVTANRFLACDVINGNVKIKGKRKKVFNHVEKIPLKVLKHNWKLFSELKNKTPDHPSKLVQAALIGYDLGKSLDQSKNQHKEIDFKKIFQKFYSFENEKIEMKKFNSRVQFKEFLYPDKKYSKEVTTFWSN